MAYLIDRNKLYNYIKAQINPYGNPFKGSVIEFGEKLMDYLLDMETVDAVPVVHGKWLYNGFVKEWECSECHSSISLSDDRNSHPNFCPNCGADMRKKVQEWED